MKYSNNRSKFTFDFYKIVGVYCKGFVGQDFYEDFIYGINILSDKWEYEAASLAIKICCSFFIIK